MLKLPAILDGVPRIVLVLAVPVIAFLAAVGISLGSGGGSGSGGGNKQQAAAVPTVAVAVTNRAPLSNTQPQTQQQTAPAAATPTPQPNRANCNAIRGTDYQSQAEQDWFKANCSGTSSPAVASAPSTGSTSPAPATSGASTSGPRPQPQAGAAAGVESPTGQKLIIPKAGINSDIYVTKMTDSKMPDPKGYFYAVAYDMSALGLGGDVNSGNFVMSGHVDCGKCGPGGTAASAIFWSARDLRNGDTAQVRKADGTLVNYVVTLSASYSATADVYGGFVSPGSADMTIITCTGTFGGGEYDKRHVVQFKKV